MGNQVPGHRCIERKSHANPVSTVISVKVQMRCWGVHVAPYTWFVIKNWKRMDVVYGLCNGAGNLVGLKVGLKWDINLNLIFLSQLRAENGRDVPVCLPP